MNTNTIPAIAFLASVAALMLLPLSAAAAVGALTVTGLSLLFVADYGRRVEPLHYSAEIVAFHAPSRGADARHAA